jgi:predicted transcriptional regulator of viral defense system
MEKFLAANAVFTVAELGSFLAKRGTTKTAARDSVLRYYKGAGRIILIRRGLYAVVPVHSDPKVYQVDPYLVASKVKPDSVLAFHTALEVHGKAYSIFRRFTYLSAHRTSPFKFQSNEYVRVAPPSVHSKKSVGDVGIKAITRSGAEINVTTLERTLVDVLDRPDLSGSWEEIWRSLGSVEYFDVEQVIKYIRTLKNATTAAKVGFFLDQHSERLLLDSSHIVPLRRLVPRQPHYLERANRKGCKLVQDWNLMVPNRILNKVWDEVS